MTNVFPDEVYYVGEDWKIHTEPPKECVGVCKCRTFDTGATRDSDSDKLDIEGFLSPIVIRRFGEYMHKHRQQSDGTLRSSDNWQKGIPLDAYMKSLMRHVLDLWLEHRGEDGREGAQEALCAILFNAQGYLYEVLRNDI